MHENKEQAREATEAEVAQRKFCAARHAEIEAMRKAFDALAGLDSDAKRRVMRWLDDGTLFPPRKYDDEPPF